VFRSLFGGRLMLLALGGLFGAPSRIRRADPDTDTAIPAPSRCVAQRRWPLLTLATLDDLTFGTLGRESRAFLGPCTVFVALHLVVTALLCVGAALPAEAQGIAGPPGADPTRSADDARRRRPHGPPPIHGDDRVSVRVDESRFFNDTPGWLLGVRPALGYDRGAQYGQAGLSLGRAFARHGYAGVHAAWRFTGRQHVRASARLGLLFQRRDIAFSSGTSLGVASVPARDELGLLSTWWGELRIRAGRDRRVAGSRRKVPSRHAFLVHVAVDLFFDKLGFRETRALPHFGVGWSVRLF
jgi:hypothetical protein